MRAAWGQDYRTVDHDILEKRRLASRTFGFVRHQVYRSKALVQPLENTPQYAPEEDRLDKNFEATLKRDHERRVARAKEVQMRMSCRHSYRQQKIYLDREKQWQAKKDHDYSLLTIPKAPNKSGSAYNVINMQYDTSYDGQLLKYKDDVRRWRDGVRRYRVQSRMSGTRNFNVINWQRTRPMDLPPMPEPFQEVSRRPRPYSVPIPEASLPPVIAPEVPRPVSTMDHRNDASENCPWELERYLFRPYSFK